MKTVYSLQRHTVIHFDMFLLVIKSIFSFPLSLSHCYHYQVCDTVTQSMLTNICEKINRIESQKEAQIVWMDFLDVNCLIFVKVG